jgi:rhodanese-related sulfurtransferase
MQRRGSIPTLVAVIAFAVSAALAQEAAPTAKPAANDFDAKQAHALVQKNRANANFVVLDIRTPAEFAAGHLAGAVNVDFKAPDFQSEVAKLDRAKTYLVYCRTGRRSTLALPILERLGFTYVYHLAGGIVAWQREGFPVEAPPTPVP